MRKFSFQNNYYYHVFNRGVDKRDIFQGDKDYGRFIRSMREFNKLEPIGSLYYKDYIEREEKGAKHPIGCLAPNTQVPSKILASEQSKKLVEFVCYCLNPNHYHFLLKQLTEGGIVEFMKRLNGGYTNYFNRKNNRSGSLLEGPYKAVKVSNYSHWLKLIVYVNCNSEVHKICPASKWPWSSFLDYLGKRNGSLCSQEIILKEFSRHEFRDFCYQVLPDIVKTKELKKYLLE